MKTKKVPLINERVIRHLARNHYNLNFCEEQEMHRRNRRNDHGGVPWLVIGSLVFTLALGIWPFYASQATKSVAITFALTFGLAGVYCTIVSSKQWRNSNRIWLEVVREVLTFKYYIGIGDEEDLSNWGELVSRTQARLDELAGGLIKTQDRLAYFERAIPELNTWAQQEAKTANLAKRVELGDEILSRMKALVEFRQRSVSERESFVIIFEKAKRLLGSDLDNGQGFEAFLKKKGDEVKKSALATLH